MAETTLFPIAALPTCVTTCGHLYDANGACVPPAAPTAPPSVYESCFCNNQLLAPFKTGISPDPCNGACNTGDLSSIQTWFNGFCGTAVGSTPTPSPTSRPVGNIGGGGGGTWLDGHYQWVIFLVIMIVGIVGIWVGACVWRRRYLRKKDRQYALGTNLGRSTASGRVVPNTSNAGSLHVPGPSMFDPAPMSSAAVYGDKPAKVKLKWFKFRP